MEQNEFIIQLMRVFLRSEILLGCLLWPAAALAWDGFDADTGELVELIPDRLPSPGDTVDVRDYNSENAQTCLVESIVRNARTIEVLVRAPDGKQHILVMEGR